VGFQGQTVAPVLRIYIKPIKLCVTLTLVLCTMWHSEHHHSYCIRLTLSLSERELRYSRQGMKSVCYWTFYNTHYTYVP